MWRKADHPSTAPLAPLLSGNKTFASTYHSADAELCARLATGQAPETLWIGCADSRIPETTICGRKPGDIFVHRNIANVLRAEDGNSAAVIEYAVAHLKVKQVVICGHTKCGGANAALGDADLGNVLNTWLGPVRELRKKHQAELEKLGSDDERATRLAELNVLVGIEMLKTNETVRKAIRDRGLTVHGLIYDIPSGGLREIQEADHHMHRSRPNHR